MIADHYSGGKRPTIGLDSVPAISPGADDPSLTKAHSRQHFATGHLLTNLKGRTVSSGFVTGVAQIAQFGITLLSIVVLARLLLPQDFGLVAMVTVITGFLRIFNDGGLSTATVQRENITHAQVSNLFWANVALGGLGSLVLAVSAPILAWFYREPRLVGVALALSVTFLLTGSTVQHLALLKRQMEFKMIAVIQIGAAMAGLVVGVIMAWLKYGYWSLVGIQVSTAAVSFLLTWLISRWRPQWPSRRSETRSLLSFGANLTASSFLWSIARGTDGLLIGRFYGAVSLGLYSRASVLLLRPVEQFMSPLEAVLVPTLSRLVSQPDRYRRVVLQVFEIVAVSSFLFTGLLFALARPLTLVILGPKWEQAAPIFAGFTLVALFIPVGSVAGWLLTSQGRGGDFVRLSVAGSIAAVLSFAAGLPFGPVGVAISYSVSCLLLFLPVNYYIAGRRGPVSTGDLWVRLFAHVPVWGVVFGATFLACTFCADASSLNQLFICVPVGVAAGVAFICVYAPSRRVALGVVTILRELKAARNPSSP